MSSMWRRSSANDEKYTAGTDYCNICQSCGRLVHISCAWELKDTRVDGDFWLCECGTQNKIYSCDGWMTED